MRILSAILLSPALLLAGHGAAAQDAPVPPPRPALSDAECEVWARELGFAQSVVAHDADAFAEHVHPLAAFGVKGPQPTRGRDAVVRSWAGIIAGEPLELRWYPTMVVVAGETGVAYSSGPALYRRRDDQGRVQVSLGGFQSIWKRGDDGTWRVLYDDGIQPVPADAAQVAAFDAGRRSACPRG